MKKLCFLVLLVGVLMVVVPRSSEDARGSVDDDNMVEDRALTYDELIQEVMKNENLTETEAKQFIGVSEENSGRATYRIYKASVTVTSTYKPQVVFYCETSESGDNRGILSLLNTSLSCDYNGSTKHFSGTLYTNLESASCIYFELNGDFYHKGTTTRTEEKNTVNFSVSYASNHFEYIYKADRYKLGR